MFDDHAVQVSTSDYDTPSGRKAWFSSEVRYGTEPHDHFWQAACICGGTTRDGMKNTWQGLVIPGRLAGHDLGSISRIIAHKHSAKQTINKFPMWHHVTNTDALKLVRPKATPFFLFHFLSLWKIMLSVIYFDFDHCKHWRRPPETCNVKKLQITGACSNWCSGFCTSSAF